MAREHGGSAVRVLENMREDKSRVNIHRRINHVPSFRELSRAMKLFARGLNRIGDEGEGFHFPRREFDGYRVFSPGIFFFLSGEDVVEAREFRRGEERAMISEAFRHFDRSLKARDLELSL